MKRALVLAIFAAAATPAWGHDHWINWGGYKSSDGARCCGENDCAVIPAESIKTGPQGYILPSGEVVPYSEAQQSEDGKYWRCHRADGSRRCFFSPQPAS